MRKAKGTTDRSDLQCPVGKGPEMCDRKDPHRRRGKGKVTVHTIEGDWDASRAECLGQ